MSCSHSAPQPLATTNYNIHLLTGKISTPGNSPFSLTAQAADRILPTAMWVEKEGGLREYEVLIANGTVDKYSLNEKHKEYANCESEELFCSLGVGLHF